MPTMYVAYCKTEAPDTKVVVGWGDVEENVATCRHADHPDAADGHFSMSEAEWTAAYVDGNPTQTSANIVTNHPDRFVA